MSTTADRENDVDDTPPVRSGESLRQEGNVVNLGSSPGVLPQSPRRDPQSPEEEQGSSSPDLLFLFFVWFEKDAVLEILTTKTRYTRGRPDSRDSTGGVRPSYLSTTGSLQVPVRVEFRP